MTGKWRSMCVDERTTWRDGREYATPVDALSGLDVLLARVATTVHDSGGVLLLDGHAPIMLGLGTAAPTTRDAGHPALAAARNVGWNVSAVSPWMTCWRNDRPSIHLGIVPWLSPRTFSLRVPGEPIDRALYRLTRFARLVGAPYHGSHAGLAAIELLRDRYRGRVIPRWRPTNWDRAVVAPEVADDWTAPRTLAPTSWRHTYDANVQYLGTAGSAILAHGELQWRNAADAGADATAKRPGSYSITVPPWHHAANMPHPCGGRAVVGERAWISSATLDLLHELAERDVIAAPEIHEAWTADGGRVLRGWATALGDAVQQARADGDPVVLEAVKSAYRTGIGMLGTPRARVHRPDWQRGVVALARANMWRRMWRTGEQSGRWPIAVVADAVTYASHDRDPLSESSWPVAMPRHDRAGGWKHAKSEGPSDA